MGTQTIEVEETLDTPPKQVRPNRERRDHKLTAGNISNISPRKTSATSARQERKTTP